MAGVGDSVIEEIKVRTDLVDLISSYGIDIKRAGSSAKACCPFHHEKTPSFNINTTRGFYHCFGCGESGDAIKFVQKMDGLTFMEAVKRLAEPLGIRVEEETADPEAALRKRLRALMAELAQFYHRCLLKMREAELAREYLAKRALDGQICEDWTIGYAPTGAKTILTWAEKYGYTPEELVAAGVLKAPERPEDSWYHRFGGRLMFTIRDRQGRVVAFSGRQLVERKNSGKYVNSPETPIFKKSNVLFGFDKAAGNIAKSPHREAIACEGQIDTIRLHSSGFPVAVASQGTAFTEEHARMLRRVCDSMVLAYDDDAAGHKATVKVGGMMLALEVPVRVVRLPDGDDPDSYLRTKGAEAFRKLMDGAESIVSFQVRSERAKEADARSIDAVARVSRAVLGTIARCPSAVLRASMVDEAARLLDLPTAALAEELAKIKVEPLAKEGSPANTEDEDWAAADGEVPPEDAPMPGEDAHESMPPPMREMALMSFLMTNERDTTIDGMLGELMPPGVFAHDFTRRFVDAWRMSVATGEDSLAAFAQGLEPGARGWFDRLLESSGRAEASGLGAVQIMQDFVRSLWCDALKRRRGELPAAGDIEADMMRMKISADLKRLNMVKWHTVKEMIGEMIKEGEKWT